MIGFLLSPISMPLGVWLALVAICGFLAGRNSR
jgi:hypothetical protein